MTRLQTHGDNVQHEPEHVRQWFHALWSSEQFTLRGPTGFALLTLICDGIPPVTPPITDAEFAEARRRQGDPYDFRVKPERGVWRKTRRAAEMAVQEEERRTHEADLASEFDAAAWHDAMYDGL